MSSEKSRSDSAIAGDSPRNNAAKETSPVESPVSCNVIVRMRKRRNRPAPECRIGCSSGVAEPVSRNWPACRRRSTSWRNSFHTSGTTCHSSSKRGVSPCNAESRHATRWRVVRVQAPPGYLQNRDKSEKPKTARRFRFSRRHVDLRSLQPGQTPAPSKLTGQGGVFDNHAHPQPSSLRHFSTHDCRISPVEATGFLHLKVRHFSSRGAVGAAPSTADLSRPTGLLRGRLLGLLLPRTR